MPLLSDAANAARLVRAKAPGALRDLLARVRRPTSDARPAAAGDVARSLDESLARLDRVRVECRRLVTRRAAWSAGAAVVPVPGLDFGTDVAILLRLLPRINERFGLTPAQIESLDTESKRLVMMFVGSVGSALVGRLVTREMVIRVLMRMGVRLTTAGIVKFAPLAGQALSATISFGAMKVLGDRHVDDCHEVARRTLLARAGSSSGDAPSSAATSAGAPAVLQSNASEAVPSPSKDASTR